MARRMGSWWIKDGLDGRRKEAQGFADYWDMVSGFDWTQDHGDANVLEKDFVVTANYNEKTEQVDYLMMSSHGSPNGFSVWDGSVSTSDSIDFGSGDLEMWASHACQVLKHESGNSVARWIPAFERLHYMCGFHTNSYSGGGRDARGEQFAWHSGVAHYVVFGLLTHHPIRTAWKKANTIVEGSDVRWAYLRATGSNANTYNEKITPNEPTDPTQNRTFWTANGQC